MKTPPTTRVQTQTAIFLNVKNSIRFNSVLSKSVTANPKTKKSPQSKTYIHICPKCKTSVILHVEGQATCIKCALKMPCSEIASKALSKTSHTNTNELAQNSQQPIKFQESNHILEVVS